MRFAFYRRMSTEGNQDRTPPELARFPGRRYSSTLSRATTREVSALVTAAGLHFSRSGVRAAIRTNPNGDRGCPAQSPLV
jgi:hypothetical protein